MTNANSPSMPVLVSPAGPDSGVRNDWVAPVAGVHVGALDGVRGLAILLVLVFHYGRSARGFGLQNPLLTASEFGWIGVDLFFVLSGFLITGILYDAKGSENYFRNFYARRSLRIFPLYYLALIVVLALAAVWPSAGIWPDFSPLWFVFYLSNVAMVSAAESDAGILGHFWSLAIEEHFYLVWPLCVLLATRRQLMAIAAGLLLLALAARLLLGLSGAASAEAMYVLTPLRLDPLAVGAICSLAVRGPAGLAPLIRPAWIAMLAGGTAVVLIVLLTSLSPNNLVMQMYGFTPLAVAFGGMLLVALSFRPANQAFCNPVLRWFGRYSYGLYVWHPIINVLLFCAPVTAALGIEGPEDSVPYLAFAFLASLAAALASYHLWEKRFLAYKHRFH